MLLEKNIKEILYISAKAIASQDVVQQGDFGKFVNRVEKNLAINRGKSDFIALKTRYHNHKIHTQLRPQNPESAKIFDLAEDIRITALGSNKYAGIACNLKEKWLFELNAKNITLAEQIAILIYNLLISNRDYQLHKLKEKFTIKDPHLLNLISSNLPKAIVNQQGYANIILGLLNFLHKEEIGEEPHTSPNLLIQDEQDNSNRETPQAEESADNQNITDISSSNNLSKTLGTPSKETAKDIPYLEQNNNVSTPNIIPPAYQIYSKEFDEIVAAEELASASEIRNLRKQLDSKLLEIKKSTLRQANILLRKLIAKKYYFFETNLEEGIMDSNKLASIISNPNNQQIYKQEKSSDLFDTVVTLLIDNSGSMRGKPITIAAICADILACTLEKCNIKVEILGFTTREWQGGKSKKIWQINGCPPFPGRLNDLRHIIYKSADKPWAASKHNLSLMLKSGLLKENIDGEGLLWAYQRLRSRLEQKKILMVISDGAPVDDSTLSANGYNYLENHLRQTITQIEKDTKIELAAIGIGYEVGHFYRNHITIKTPEELGKSLFSKLSELF